jgi:hypothetical protein
MVTAWRNGGRGGVHDLACSTLAGRFATGVSLHAHSHHSREVMADLPPYLDRIPIVARLLRREMRQFVQRNGEAVDFSKGWWHPPVGPAAVVESECAQIVEGLGLDPLVSITDHDNIDASVALLSGRPDTPVSFEWTVPFGEGFFHLGIHNLDAESARSTFDGLSAFTRHLGTQPLPHLLGQLNAHPATLVVLNHPLWDLAGVGGGRHAALLTQFLRAHGRDIHALEANGYRSGQENADVGALAEQIALPLISGGDRHGYAPNSLLNLTSARTFSDFVGEIRKERASDIVIMPDYHQPLIARKLSVAADAIRENPFNPLGRRRWNDRVSYERRGCVVPLSKQWPNGGPLWVRSAIRAFQVLTSPPLLPATAFLTLMLASQSAPVPEAIALAEMESDTQPHAAVAE